MIYSIWGFMGSGKSTIGHELAQVHNVQHVDSDQQIELMQKRSIADIFATEGETYFRDLETSFLQQLVNQAAENRLPAKLVLTTGGGMPIREDNRELLKQLGPSIFLDVSFEEIVSRLKQDQSRPLWDSQQLEAMKLRYEQRLPLYQQADLIIQATNRSIAEIIEEIKQHMV